MDVDDFKPASGTPGRQDRLENSAEEARAALAQRRKVLDDVNAIAAYAKEMKDFLEESELTERRAFIETFVKEILVVPGDALMRYTVPMPDDSLVPGKATRRWPFPMPFYLPCTMVAYTYRIANFSVGSSDIRSSVWWAYIPAKHTAPDRSTQEQAGCSLLCRLVSG